jgi:hypothetical protein
MDGPRPFLVGYDDGGEEEEEEVESSFVKAMMMMMVILSFKDERGYGVGGTGG